MLFVKEIYESIVIFVILINITINCNAFYTAKMQLTILIFNVMLEALGGPSIRYSATLPLTLTFVCLDTGIAFPTQYSGDISIRIFKRNLD
jgi:ABC-type uncharacterized transport system permease subunit